MKKISILLVMAIIIIVAVKYEGDSHENNKISVQSDVQINENIISDEVKKEKKEKMAESLNGKTIAFIGDSWIEGYGNDFKGISDYVSEKLPDVHFIDNSKSGSTVTSNSGNDNIIMINQARTLTGNPDIIMFDGGANDIMGYALGFLSNDLKKEIGTIDMNSNTISAGDTVMTDFEQVIFELKCRFPNAKLCYVNPFLIDDEMINHLSSDASAIAEIQSRRNMFYEQVIKMCNKWKMEYLDVSTYFIGTGNTYRQDDWTHIKHEGYELITPHIIDKLKEM